jgi:hypothetical protein
MIAPGSKRYGPEFTGRTAHAAPLAEQRVYRNIVRIGTANGAETANRHTGPAPGAGLRVYFGNVFALEKKLQAVPVSDHRQAAGTVAVAYASDKRGLESPHGMYETLFFERPVQIEGFSRRKAFEKTFLRPRPERFQESFLYVQQLFGVDSKAEAEAVVGPARSVFAANAWDANDRVCQGEHFFHIFNRNYLAEMVSALPFFNYRITQAFSPRGRLPGPEQILFKVKVRPRCFTHEIADEAASFHIREQFPGVIFSPQVPLFSFPVLVAETAHRNAPGERSGRRQKATPAGLSLALKPGIIQVQIAK